MHACMHASIETPLPSGIEHRESGARLDVPRALEKERSEHRAHLSFVCGYGLPQPPHSETFTSNASNSIPEYRIVVEYSIVEYSGMQYDTSRASNSIV